MRSVYYRVEYSIVFIFSSNNFPSKLSFIYEEVNHV